MVITVKAQTIISEIEVTGEHTACFSCSLAAPAELSLILQDELGRSRLEKRFTLAIGKNRIELHLPELSAGLYNAWIDVAGQTFIRPLTVENGHPSSFIAKFKQWFNLF